MEVFEQGDDAVLHLELESLTHPVALMVSVVTVSFLQSNYLFAKSHKYSIKMFIPETL